MMICAAISYLLKMDDLKMPIKSHLFDDMNVSLINDFSIDETVKKILPSSSENISEKPLLVTMFCITGSLRLNTSCSILWLQSMRFMSSESLRSCLRFGELVIFDCVASTLSVALQKMVSLFEIVLFEFGTLAVSLAIRSKSSSICVAT